MFKKAELMAVLAIQMPASEMEKSAFLKLLPETLLKETKEILEDSHKAHQLVETLNEALQEKKPVFMTLEKENESRQIHCLHFRGTSGRRHH